MEILHLLNEGAKILKSGGIVSNKLDSEILLSKALNTTRENLLISLDNYVSKNKIIEFKKLIKRRYAREPIAYILKEKEFWSKKFIVDKETLIPRPETELMVDLIIKKFIKKNISILDIGTGTGCILISILSELTNSKGIGIDISKKSIRIAKKNSVKHQLSHRIKFYTRSIDNIYFKKFDLVVSNPPYIKKKDIKNLDDDIKKYEPKLALDGGNDGLDVIKKVIYKSKNILKVKGMLALEIDNEQFADVSNILRKNNFRIKHLVNDYQENIRCVLSTLEI